MTLALSEVIIGQLIAACPPTLAVLVSLIVLRAGQKKNAAALDGKLTQLMVAERGVARAEGAAQERTEERVRVAEAVPLVTAAIAQAAVAATHADPDKVAKMEIVNQDENAVPMRAVEPKNKEERAT